MPDSSSSSRLVGAALEFVAARPLGTDPIGEPGTLVDRPHGIELGRSLGAADQMDAAAGGDQRLIEALRRFLAGADDNRVGGNQPFATIDHNVETGVVDLAIGHAA